MAAFVLTIIFSFKLQLKENEPIALKYTKSHIVKLVFVCLNLLVCGIVMILDFLSKNILDMIGYLIYTFLWAFSILLLRREFKKLGRTSGFLIGFWSFLLLDPLIILLIEVRSDSNRKNSWEILTIINLMLNAFVVILSIAKRIDVHNIYSRSSTTYNQILNSYFPEDVSLEDPEKLWDKWDALAEETVPIVERENIKSIKINNKT